MILALIALLLPTGAMWGLLRSLRMRSGDDSRLLTGAIAFCLGLGFSSVGTFAWAVVAGGINRLFVAADAALWIAVAVAVWRRHVHAAHERSISRESRNGALWSARAVFVVVGIMAAAAAVGDYVAAPHGHSDATLIWNLKARFMIRGGDDWAGFLDVPWSSPSHPMLVSASVARLWAYAGWELPIAPALLGTAAAAAIAAVLIGALDARRPRAWVAAALVIAPWTFSDAITAQTADLPLAMFLVVTLVVLAQENRGRGDAWPVALAGALAGCTAWTKNEGVVVLLAALAMITWRAMHERRVNMLVPFVAGALPLLLAIAWLKLVLAPVAPEYFGDAAFRSSQPSTFDPANLARVGSLVWQHLWHWGGNAATGLLPLVTAAAIAVASSSRGWVSRRVLPVLAIAFASFCAVWVVTPLDTTWLVSTTADRLFLQLWPSLVLAACSAPLPWRMPEGNLV